LTILITSTNWWHHPAKLALALGKAGARIAVTCPKGSSLLISRIASERYPYRSMYPLSSLKDAIEGARPDLIVPCDDLAVEHLHELHAEAVEDGPRASGIRELVERSLGSPEGYASIRSRAEILAIAREEGILVPESGAIKDPLDLERWNKIVEFPWVLKRDGSSSGMGVRIVGTFAEAGQARRRLAAFPTALYVFKRIVANRDPFLIRDWLKGGPTGVTAQAFVAGSPANIAFSCWKGEVLAAVSVVVCETLRRNGAASVVRLTDDAAMLNAAERMARRLGLSGFYGLDFMIDERTGAAYCIELNPRAPQLCHLRLGRGRDLTAALVARLLGVPIPDSPRDSTADTIAIFPRAWLQNPGNEVFSRGFHDVPWEEPELIDEMLRAPRPERGFLQFAINCLRDSFTRNSPGVEKRGHSES
jgi:glutathione synthase/RimK-type ligase-like ATP-grasp enzyme